MSLLKSGGKTSPGDHLYIWLQGYFIALNLDKVERLLVVLVCKYKMLIIVRSLSVAILETKYC